MFKWENILDYAKPLAKTGLILLIGHFIIVYVAKIIKKGISHGKLDLSLANFLVKTIDILLHFLLVLSALNSIGVSTSGIVAALSAAVVALGVALKDSLSNVAGGILLLVSPRFKAGDYIETENDGGTVLSVDLLHTTIRTPDNKQISIPNGVLINSHIINYSQEEKRRVDITIPIPYESDVRLAKQIIKNTISNHPQVLKEPAEPLVRVMSYENSAVNIITRSWCNTADYWDVYFDLTEQIREALEENNIFIPYNKIDVRITKDCRG